MGLCPMLGEMGGFGISVVLSRSKCPPMTYNHVYEAKLSPEI